MTGLRYPAFVAQATRGRRGNDYQSDYACAHFPLKIDRSSATPTAKRYVNSLLPSLGIPGPLIAFFFAPCLFDKCTSYVKVMTRLNEMQGNACQAALLSIDVSSATWGSLSSLRRLFRGVFHSDVSLSGVVSALHILHLCLDHASRVRARGFSQVECSFYSACLRILVALYASFLAESMCATCAKNPIRLFFHLPSR